MTNCVTAQRGSGCGVRVPEVVLVAPGAAGAVVVIGHRAVAVLRAGAVVEGRQRWRHLCQVSHCDSPC